MEPCGCTSDPLGDLARTAALVGGAPLFDGGSTLYTERPVTPEMRPQESAKARVLADTLPKMGLWAAGVGPYDLADGADGILFPRQAANAQGIATAPPFVRVVSGVKIGVFGVVDPAMVPVESGAGRRRGDQGPARPGGGGRRRARAHDAGGGEEAGAGGPRRRFRARGRRARRRRGRHRRGRRRLVPPHPGEPRPGGPARGLAL